MASPDQDSREGSTVSGTIRSLVCLGDSFTEGMCDQERTDGRYLGWADRVARALAVRAAEGGGSLSYANLAIRGKLLDQVVAEQLDLGISFAPDLVSFHAGPNDVLRPGVDQADLRRRYEAAVARLAGDRSVLVFTSIERAGGSGRFADYLSAKFARFNAGVREVAARHGLILVDLERERALTDRRLWAADRLHLNELGHSRVAAAVLERLGETDPELLGGAPGWWREPLPPKPPTRRRDDLAADVQWLGTHMLPWIGRRIRRVSSGDGLAPKDPRPRAVAAR